MATYKQLPQKKAKGPDEFISFFDHLYHRIYLRGPAYLAVGGIFLFVILGIIFWREFHIRSAESTSQKIYEASKKGKDEQIKVLADIRKVNPYSPLGMWVTLQMANQQEDCNEVIKDLNSYVGYGENEILRSLVYLKTGTCLENQMKWESALDLYQRASGDSNNIFRDWSHLRLAQVYRYLGKDEEMNRELEGLVSNSSKARPAIQEMAKMLKEVPEPLMKEALETESQPLSESSPTP